MVIGTVSIIGGIIGLLGIALKTDFLLFFGLILFLIGLGVGSLFISLPWYIWAIGILLFVFAITKKK